MRDERADLGLGRACGSARGESAIRRVDVCVGRVILTVADREFGCFFWTSRGVVLIGKWMGVAVFASGNARFFKSYGVSGEGGIITNQTRLRLADV